MKPDWDKLMAEYSDNKTALVADVDCTAEGKPLCDSNGVRGFPTIKYGDPSALEDYQGGRDFDSLQSFAKENLKAMCSPANLDLCEGEAKENIEKYLAMDMDALDTEIQAGDKKMQEAEETFKSEVEKLQKKYEELQNAKETAVQEVKTSGHALLKSVKAHKAKSS